jgi:hypothetical protein
MCNGISFSQFSRLCSWLSSLVLLCRVHCLVLCSIFKMTPFFLCTFIVSCVVHCVLYCMVLCVFNGSNVYCFSYPLFMASMFCCVANCVLCVVLYRVQCFLHSSSPPLYVLAGRQADGQRVGTSLYPFLRQQDPWAAVDRKKVRMMRRFRSLWFFLYIQTKLTQY